MTEHLMYIFFFFFFFSWGGGGVNGLLPKAGNKPLPEPIMT